MQAQKAGTSKLVKNKVGYAGDGINPYVNKYAKSQVEGNATTSSNPSEVIISADDQISPILEEGKLQQSEVNIEEGEVNKEP